VMEIYHTLGKFAVVRVVESDKVNGVMEICHVGDISLIRGVYESQSRGVS
jgi:hypothetical protein